MSTLTWDQVSAWRLSQHSLLERAKRGQMLDVVSHMYGVHAQLMSAAELQMWVRVADISPDDVQNALWRDKTLVKTWAMRGTLHLLTAADFPLYMAAQNPKGRYRQGSWLKYHGITLDEIEAIIEGTRTSLGAEGITRQQLATTIAEKMGKPHLAKLLGSGWGALLKPAAFQGYLCFGPNQGQNVTFARWWGFEPSKARKVYKALGDEITEVEVEGWKGWLLTSTLKQIETTKAVHSVRLLPHFDPYTIAVAKHSKYLMPKLHKAKVYRSQGWISPVVLVDGRIAGIWKTDKQKSKITVTVEMFDAVDKKIQAEIETEIQQFGQFLDTKVESTFA